jgi:DNA-binding transcriptional LysR family regulator
MEIKQLQSFVEVVRQGSFTKAAEVLYISQPTISTHIRQLEDELHIRLLLRTTKSLEVTPKGRELYEYALNILDLTDRIRQRCSQEEERIIHLGASTIPSAYILPEVLPAFGRHSPEIYFVIHQGDSQEVVDGLLDNVFDLGLIGMQADSDALESIPFHRDHMVLITPVNAHFLALKQRSLAGEAASGASSAAASHELLAELLQEPIILREKGSGSKKSVDLFFESIGLAEENLRITARINDQEAIKNLVAGGLGVSIISEKAAQNFLLEKRLLAFPLPDATAARSLYLAYRKDYILKPYVQDFIRFLRNFYAAPDTRTL